MSLAVLADERGSTQRIFQIGFWSVISYVIIISFAVILWHDLIEPTYFPVPTDGWVAPSGAGCGT